MRRRRSLPRPVISHFCNIHFHQKTRKVLWSSLRVWTWSSRETKRKALSESLFGSKPTQAQAYASNWVLNATSLSVYGHHHDRYYFDPVRPGKKFGEGWRALEDVATLVTFDLSAEQLEAVASENKETNRWYKIGYHQNSFQGQCSYFCTLVRGWNGRLST